MVKGLESILPAIVEAARRAHVAKLWVYGSATGNGDRVFSSASDIDLLVEFANVPATSRGFKHPLFTLGDELSALVGRTVHVTENLSFRNPYFRDAVTRTRELIYDDAVTEVAVGHP